MAGVTPEGFVTKDLATIRQEIDDEQRATIDAGLDLSDQDPLGQVNAVMSGAFAELWEVAQAVYASQYPDSANGSSLDNVASITGTNRSADTKTQVVGQVTLNPNVALPALSVANLSGQPNARFLSQVEVPANPVGGTFSVLFEAESAGFLAVAPNQLTEIAEPVTGWTAVDNAAAPTVPGSNTETDPQLRVKRAAELTAGGSTSVDAIRANLIQLAGVLDARVTEDLVAHTIACVLRGGAAADITQEIFNSKAGGIDTVGTLSEVVLDSQGVGHTIRYDFATELVFHCDITVVTDPLVFDTVGGPDAIKAAIATYVNGLNIAQDVIYETVKAAVIPVTPGCGVEGVVNVTAALIGFGVADQVVDLPVGASEVATSDVANIAVTVT